MKNVRVILFVSVIIACTSQHALAVDYSGNSMLAVLGASKNSPQFKEFKDSWQLDRMFENHTRGIKVYVNDISDRVESIMLAGEGMEVNGLRYVRCNTRLPFGIKISDDTTTLVNKLGAGEKLLGRSAMKFYQHNVNIEVVYTDLKGGKISSVKFSPGSSKPGLKPDIKLAPPKSANIDNTRKSEQAKFAIHPGRTIEKTVYIAPPFKRAILNVFKAAKEGLASIRTEPRTEGNFWNYKYTYDTKLKIPGEKYNMLYSFPFINSQLDFVVVLKEADHYDNSFAEIYHSFEKQLLSEFTPSEGWVGACLPNNNKSQLSDLEVRNDKYGSVILDYSKNPKGRCVLLLRFLLFSN